MSDYNVLKDKIADRPDYNHLVYFRRHEVQPPGFEYVTRDDILLLSMWSPTASSTIQLSLRVLGPDGTIRPRFETLIGATVGTVPATLVLDNMEGFLLSAQVVSTNAPQGQAYVTLEIVRGRGTGDATRGAILLAGYPDQLRSIGYPETLPRSSIEGPGLMRILTGAAPLLGAEISITVPAGRQWVLGSLRFSVTTGAGVPTRSVAFTIDDGAGNIAFEVSDFTLIAAATTLRLCFASGSVSSSAQLVDTIGIVQGFRLLPGWRIQTLTNNLDPGDQFSAQVMMVEEFVTA